VTTFIQANEPELQNTALSGNSSSAGAPAAAASATELPQSPDDEWSNPLEAQPVALDQDLEPLTEEEVATLHKFLAAMPPEVRKRFTIEFRHHFQVPKEARTIKDRITQQRHKAFIDVFERELAEVTP
jgi:HPt (histidine-containing phosphotransfer) domain-containing protein